jgi:hypothetical protein
MNREYNLTIHAVGKTVKGALVSLGRDFRWGKVENIEEQTSDVPARWFVRFTAGGTSMKAAGEYVRGGVIVTWWK